jgi:hypothetical protein
MPTGDIETFHEDATWRNRVAGQNGLLGTHCDKETAVEAGRAEAHRRQVKHVVRNTDDGSGTGSADDQDPRPS